MIRAGLVGVTGIIGQQFVAALQDHPWFELTQLVASERSAGKTYREALTDSSSGKFRWYQAAWPRDKVLDLPVRRAAELDLGSLDVVFSATEADVARELEPRFAAEVPVVSTASAHRMEPDVPLFVSTINADHAQLIDVQRKNRGWKGFIAPQPNCTAIGLATTLKPINDRFGIRLVLMTSMQAISGAGRNGGVLGLDILDNVIPYIPKEEEKVQSETQKVLGQLWEGGVKPAEYPVSCTCTRANVMDGHTEAVFVSTERPASISAAREAFEDFQSGFESLGLPSAPSRLITFMEDPYRPQPRLDRDTEDGMTTTVGRLRKDHALTNGLKWVLVSHNTKNGGSKGAVLVAEMLSKKGYIGG
ncbi:MAG TPA: aspartate-semialdehyde dehydrogenase [Chloroflexota bacterium]|nr:aspartate-semialdehyde dehydrogenase [Chloroflexota bacterium]